MNQHKSDESSLYELAQLRQQYAELKAAYEKTIALQKQTEDALLKSEQKYFVLFEKSAFPVTLSKLPEGIIVDVNEAFEREFGLTKQEVLGKSSFELGINTDAEGRKRILDVLKENNSVRNQEMVLHSRSGEKNHYETNIDKVLINGEEYLLNTSQNISEYKRAENKLKENYDLIRIAGEKAKLGGWIVLLKENRSYWSDEVASIHEMPAGYAPQVEDAINFYAPEWRDLMTEVFGKCVQEGISYDEEMEIITATGKRVWVRTMGEAVRDENGNIFKIQGAFQDISLKKQAEEELIKSKSELEEYFENDISANYMVSASGEIISCNKTFLSLFGFEKRSDAEGFDITGLFKKPNDSKQLIHLIQKQGKVQNYEVEFILKEGKTIYTLINALGIFDKDNMLENIRGYVIDITDRKDVENELQKNEEKFRRFFEEHITGNYHTTLDGTILTCNDAFVKMLKYKSKEEIFAINTSELYFGISDREKFINKLRAEKKLESNELTLKAFDGSLVEIVENVIGIFDESGELKEIIGYMSDITEQKKAQFDLRESEIRYRDFFESDLTGDYIATTDGVILDCNPAFIEILGYDATEEIIGSNISEIYQNPAERQDFLKLIQNKKVLKDYNTRLKRKDGAVIICNENIVGKFDANETMVQYFGYMYDITDKVHAEEELIKKEQLLSSVVDTQQELICRFLPDTTIIFANKAYCKLFGITEKELIGSKFLQFVSESEWVQELSILRSLNTNNPQRTSVSKALRADGSVITLEWTDIAIFNEKGEVVEFQSVGHDITEILKAKQEILYHSQMQELLRDISSTFIYVLVDQINSEIQKSIEKLGRFIEADRAYIFDYDWFKYSCSNTFEWCKDGIEPQIQVLQNVSLKEIPQWVNAHRNGQVLHIPDVFKLDINDGARQILEPQGIKSLLTVPIMGDNECIGFIGFDSVSKHHSYSQSEEKLLLIFAQLILNIKNRQLLENSLVLEKEKAVESDRLKSAFLANISHEIRTPMNGILGFTELLLEPDLSSEQKESFIKIVHQSGERMLNTVNDIVEFSKIEAGMVYISVKETDVNSSVEELISFFKPEAEQKGLKLILEKLLPAEKKNISTDRNKLDSILTNLLKNAIKYTETGTIKIGCQVKDPEIEFYIKDTGIGISKQRQEPIFERFIQADITDKMAYQGAGLGLAISKAYVEILGGKIWVESEEGLGSTFYFTLPLNPAPPRLSVAETRG